MSGNRKWNGYKPRVPLSIENALLNAIGRLGIVEAAHLLGKNQSTLRGWADPDQPEKRLAVLDAEAIDLALIKAGHEPLNLLAYQARLHAEQADEDVPGAIQHAEWALAQLEQAAAALKQDSLLEDECREALRLLNAIAGRAAAMTATIHERQDQPRVPRAVG